MCEGNPDDSNISGEAAREELEKQLRTSLKKLEEGNDIVKGLKRLINKNRLDQVVNQREQFIEEYQRLNDKIMKEPDRQKLAKDFEEKVLGDFQKQLRVQFELGNQHMRQRELGDVLFYFLLSGDEPDPRVRVIIRSLHDPLYTTIFPYNWYELCCVILRQEESSSQFLDRLGKNQAVLEYLVGKQPQLLLNDQSCQFIETLSKHLSHETFHKILRDTRNNLQQTCVFYQIQCSVEVFICLYQDHLEDMYELLSIRDVNGRTALHVETSRNLNILLGVLTATNLGKVNAILNIKNNDNKSTYDEAVGWNQRRILWMRNQFENRQYPLYHSPVVLILYNTTDRPGAEEEARPIYDVFKQIVPRSTMNEKMKTKRETIERVSKAAGQARSGLVVILMSHGHPGTVEDSEREGITLTSIEGAMCSDNMKGKPKVMIVQSCQRDDESNSQDSSVSQDSSKFDAAPLASERTPKLPYIPPVSADFCTILSSMHGQLSERGVFIPYLADYLHRSGAHENIIDIASKVSTQMNREEKKQTPILHSTLRANFCIKDKFMP